MMNEDKVWQLIDSANALKVGNKQKQAFLAEKLLEFSDEDIVTFDFVISELHYKAETWDLVAVDKIFQNESMMSEDNHYMFNFAVISLGKEIFYKLLENADEIIHYLPESVPYQYNGCYFFDNYFYGVGYHVVEKKFNRFKNSERAKLYDEIYKRVAEKWKLENGISTRSWETHGYKAKSLQELQERLPKIWKRFEKHRNYEEVFDMWVNYKD
jgi:hypothetical protein